MLVVVVVVVDGENGRRGVLGLCDGRRDVILGLGVIGTIVVAVVVGGGSGTSSSSSSSLIHAGIGLLHKPVFKHVIICGPSTSKPVGQSISAREPNNVPFDITRAVF